jgi:hypothetical protein
METIEASRRYVDIICCTEQPSTQRKSRSVHFWRRKWSHKLYYVEKPGTLAKASAFNCRKQIVEPRNAFKFVQGPVVLGVSL